MRFGCQPGGWIEGNQFRNASSGCSRCNRTTDITGPATPTITYAAKTPATISHVSRNGGKPPGFTATPNNTAPAVPTQKHSRHMLRQFDSSPWFNFLA